MTALAKDRARFVETEIDQDIVVMVLDNGEFFSLQGTARAAWKLIDGTRVLAALATRYAVWESRRRPKLATSELSLPWRAISPA